MDAKGEMDFVPVCLNGDGSIGLASVPGLCVRMSLRVGNSYEKTWTIAVGCWIYSSMNNTC